MPEEIATLIGNKQTMIIGDGIAKLLPSVVSLVNAAYQPHARHVAKLAASQLQQKQPGLDIAPVYLKTPDVSEAKKLFWSLHDDYSAT